MSHRATDDAEGFMELVRAMDYYRRRIYRCTRERCWVHLLDEGCASGGGGGRAKSRSSPEKA